MEMTAVLLGGAELLLLGVGALLLFIRMDYSVAEAVSYAVITTLMCLSCIFQITFLIGFPFIAVGMEVLLLFLAMIGVFRNRKELSKIGPAVLFMLSRHPVALGGMLISGILLVIIPFFDLPAEGVWESVEPVFRTREDQPVFMTPGDPISETGWTSVNILLLPYLFTRHGTMLGTGLIGFFGYVGIGFSTYALSRRYSWPSTAITVSMVVMSLPRFVFQAISPGDEILPAAVSLFCILGVYRVAEQPNIRDLLLLILGILFGISGGMLSLVFPLILLVVSTVILLRRHGVSVWVKMARDHWRMICLSGFPAFIFSQSWLTVLNLFQYRTSNRNLAQEWAYNTDGIMGAFANLIRYFSEGIYLPRRGIYLMQKFFGINTDSLFPGLLDRIPWIFGSRGASVPFSFSHLAGNPVIGFGPLALILIWPAIIYTLLRGPQKLKTIAWGLLVYVYLVALIPAWTPLNVRYFSHFYACGGFLTALLLPPWRLTRKGKTAVQIVCIGLLTTVFWYLLN
ncbi:MAG: hypothetical protein AB1659_00580 [Thermodesulfobacteriota bacterium]